MEENIKITNIEAELNRLWESHKVANRVRACLFTLVVYAQTKESGNSLKELMRLILERYPCRIIFIQEDRNLENRLKVNVSNEIVGDKEGEVACDLIMIEVASSQLHRVPFIVLPHFVPDLPIYFLWGQDPSLDLSILPILARYANRLIFNRSHREHFQQFSQNMITLIQSNPHQDFIDMEWLIGQPWRNALRYAFELKKAYEWLKISNQIHIHYNDLNLSGQPPTESQTAYLISWLASLMQWKFEKKEQKDKSKTLKFLAKEGKSCSIYITPEQDPDYPSGAVLKMELSSHDEHYMSIVPLNKTSKGVVHISSTETCEIPYTIPLNLKSTSLDIHSLLYIPMSNHYPLMLQKMSSIEW
jgi:glucose-6-phosphate dehydrogenase assembly protein OpcA